MKTYISLLRGINVSGQKKVGMGELKKLYESLGFRNVQTYIQSGNIIFECSDIDTSELVSKIEEKIKQSFNFSVVVLIRTKNEFQKLIEKNPFVWGRKEDITKLHVTFLSDVPDKVPMREIEEAKSGSEELFMFTKEIYLFCPDGYGRTKLSNNFFEKKLNVSTTTRNLKTVNKLFDLAK